MTKLINRTIADRWEDGLLIGNGKIGLALYGNPHITYLDFTVQDLFLKGNQMQKLPYLAPYLEELRSIIDMQGYREGIRYFYERAQEQGYKGLTMSDPFIPAARFLIEIKQASIENYQRITDFQNGMIQVTYDSSIGGKVEETLFASKKENCIFGKIKSEKPLTGSIIPVNWKEIKMEEKITVAANGKLKWEHRYQDQTGYDVIWSIDSTDGRIISKRDSLMFHDSTTIYFTIQCVEKNREERQVRCYEKAVIEHKKSFSKKFNAVKLLLTDEQGTIYLEEVLSEMRTRKQITPVFMQLFYQASRYIIQSMANGIPTLQGIWSGTLHPAWSGDYTFDTNVQLAISSLASSGYFAEYRSFFERLKKYYPDFRENAQSYYGCHGFLVPAHASTTAKHVHWNEEWPLIFWISGAGWLAYFYHEYWHYTKDAAFLKHECIPFYEEVLAFYLDFAQCKEGKLRLSPSYSAENGMGDNTTMDIAIVKSVLKYYIEAKTCLGEEVAKIYKQFYKQIPPYRLLEDGGIAEWLDPRTVENDNHRHFSNLYPLFQTKEINQDTPELWESAKIAFRKRMDSWLNNIEGDTTSSHGRMHAAMCAISLEQTKEVTESLEALVLENAFMDSLATAHYRDKNIFNVDANGSLPKVIHDCLIYSEHEDSSVTILKTVPYFLSRGKATGICLPDNFYVQALEWDIEKGDVSITLEQKENRFPNLNLGNQYHVKKETTHLKQLNKNMWQYTWTCTFDTWEKR
ncbi:glycoside hydrolase N-terminal domain-containing protein [Niallia sp. FSL W8-0177]|uniref:glycosyl hydrolase family 95 catalytic domain-containing protein n=1 Tax=Niallia sp. FSL W8-0177 TaxID=2954522 RepID=UPI0030F646B4